MKKIKRDNIEYILIKEPTKKAGYTVQWYKRIEEAIQVRSLRRILKVLQELVSRYHDSCIMLDRIPEPQYQMVLMMSAGTSQYKKHSLRFIAKQLNWNREEVLKLVVFLLNRMEPELIDSPNYTGVMLGELDTDLLNRKANMRFS